MSAYLTQAERRRATLVTHVRFHEDWRSSMEVMELWGHGAPIHVEWANHDAGTVDITRGRLHDPHGYEDALHLFAVDGYLRRMSFPVGIVRDVYLVEDEAATVPPCPGTP